MKFIALFVLVALNLSSAYASESAQSGPRPGYFNSGLAVVLIDMQKGFYERGDVEGTRGLNHLVLEQQRLLKWAKGNLVPVLVFEYENFGATDPRLMKILTRGKFRVIEKDQDGGFYGKSHDEALATLKRWGVDTLIVAGINGPYCVQSTIEGALENGFDVMTTHWVLGNINQNPPIFPNGSWRFKHNHLVIFPTLQSIVGKQVIQPRSRARLPQLGSRAGRK